MGGRRRVGGPGGPGKTCHVSAGGVLGCPVLGSGACGAGEGDRVLGSSHAGQLCDRPAAEVTTEQSSGRGATPGPRERHGLAGTMARGLCVGARTRVPAALRGALHAGRVEVGSDPTRVSTRGNGCPVA